MQISCKCLNVIINSRGSIIDNYAIKSKGVDHPFFKENIGCVELENIHKEQSSLFLVENCGEWVINRCINCRMYTHALNNTSSAIILINRALLTKPQDIAALKSNEKYSPAFRIVIDSNVDEDGHLTTSGTRNVTVNTPLHRQLTEWIQREASLTEERVRQYSEQQYAALDHLRNKAHKEHLALTRILAEAMAAQKSANSEAKTSQQFSHVTNSKPSSPLKAIPILPDPSNIIAKRPTQAANRVKNVSRKPSVDAEGLFDLDGMDDTTDTFRSDEDLSDTDDSGSHDEGIHIPRHVNSSVYAKSLPVNVPTFMQHLGSNESLNHSDHRVPEDPMDIAASIKALAKSVHGDAVFGDLPRPRFSSQI